MLFKYCVASVFVVLIFCIDAYAAVCAAGKYLPAGATSASDCASCASKYYCPGDDTQHDCPKWSPDYSELVPNLVKLNWAKVPSFTYSPKSAITDCASDIDFSSVGGRGMKECRWNGSDYWTCDFWWYEANVGYYLSSRAYSGSSGTYYKTVLECTNKPPHSHYTTSGDPNKDNCEWECDCGYELSTADTCVAVASCGTGMGTIKSGAGQAYKLYTKKTTSPSVVIKYENRTCYACLEAGTAMGEVNVNYNERTYHMTN